MKWWIPWLLPVGMLEAVVFLSIFDAYSAIAALVVAGIVLPLVLRVHFPSDRDDPDADVHYWRLGGRYTDR